MADRQSVKALWAKKDGSDGLDQWLSLEMHLKDTMHVMEILWENWLADGQKQIVLQSIGTKDLEEGKKLAKFLGAVHDLGKATPAFQTKSNRFIHSPDLEDKLLEQLHEAGFYAIKDLQLMSPQQTPHALASHYLLKNFGVNDDICLIVSGHHGKPLDVAPNNCGQMKSYQANYYQVEDAQHPVYQEWQYAQKNLFDWALHSAGYAHTNALPNMNVFGQVILSGLLIMADWIASNPSYFPLVPLDEPQDEIDWQSRYQNTLHSWFVTEIWKPTDVANISEFYEQRFGFKPKDMQRVFSETICGFEQPGLFILEAPMGLGKTEAALAAVEHMAQKTGRSGLFFGLPTQATSNGIFSRVKNWLDNICADDCKSKSIRLLHGKAALNRTFTSIANGIDIDGEHDASVIVNQWFSGKKTAILDDFVVGTVDQFLLCALRQNHLALRHLGLSKKVLVIDEVHAYDAYMNRYLARALQWMGSYGVPVVLLSATLPAHTRTELVKAYALGAGVNLNKIPCPKHWDLSHAYPLITYIADGILGQRSDFSAQENTAVAVQRLDEDQLIAELDALLSDGGVAGIIVNTVMRAQSLAERLAVHFGEDRIELLHAGFIATDRMEKENALLHMIGKNADRPQKKIIVGTQVMEQSLDIDFDVLVSDLAPMDLLLQRVGRLHRHASTARPEKLRTPKLLVMGTSSDFQFDSGSSAVYGPYLLIRTQYYLPDTLSIPQDISSLVQKVYGEETLILNEDHMNLYMEAKEKEKKRIKNKERSAEAYLLQKPMRNKGSIAGWLNNISLTESGERGFAQVRDGGDTVEVIVVKEMDGGYGFIHEKEDISTRISETEIAQKLATQTIRLPSVLCHPMRISKLIEELEEFNRQELSSWQEERWLKGSLGIILDENNFFDLMEFRLCYNEKYGLQIMKG